MTPNRYAIYFVPDPSEEWAQFCTAWLGWNVNTGKTVSHPEICELEQPVSALTTVPRRYGLHATLKPPFRLQAGKTTMALERAFEDLASGMSPVTVSGLKITAMGRFLALTGTGDLTELNALAASAVRELDGFRAPPTEQELARRRQAPLSPAHDEMLVKWGYPYVMEHFRFHMTLTGKLPKDMLAPTQAVLSEILDGSLPQPLRIDDLALVGEDDDGFFHLIKRAPLGSSAG